MTGKFKKKGLPDPISVLYGSPAATFQGPGDIVSGATTWASPARAYTRAFAAGGTAIMDLVDQAGGSSVAINILATGFVDVAAINAWVTANAVTTIKVTKLYDQTGSSLHWTQATLGNMPTLTLSAINGLPGVTCASSSAQRLDTPQTINFTSGMSFSAVAKRTANLTTKQAIIGEQTIFPVGLGFAASADTATLWFNVPNLTRSASDTTFHAVQGVINGSSSVLDVDGNSTTGSITGSSQANQGFRLGRDQGGNNPLDGIVMEVGAWTTTTFTSANITSISSNQHGISGYNF